MYKKYLGSALFCVSVISSSAYAAAPAMPSSVFATVNNGNDVHLQWSSVPGALRYIRQVRIDSEHWSNPDLAWKNGKLYETTSANYYNIRADGYQYRVKACNNDGCSNYTYSNKIVINGAPQAPENVTATVQNSNDINISWSAVSGASSYVREAKVNGGDWINPKAYIDTSVSFNNVSTNRYQYRVRACNSVGCSLWTYSNSVTVY
ncbi:fibronectin type III domain-containing protein [Pseudoalteromonas piscicida]|uniref:fibronectin type III domain-containing protein n=1 Tax=Pseudoalteromonas piscicida TaxID=43662 RepID=UPI00309B2B4C